MFTTAPGVHPGPQLLRPRSFAGQRRGPNLSPQPGPGGTGACEMSSQNFMVHPACLPHLDFGVCVCVCVLQCPCPVVGQWRGRACLSDLTFGVCFRDPWPSPAAAPSPGPSSQHLPQTYCPATAPNPEPAPARQLPRIRDLPPVSIHPAHNGPADPPGPDTTAPGPAAIQPTSHLAFVSKSEAQKPSRSRGPAAAPAP